MELIWRNVLNRIGPNNIYYSEWIAKDKTWDQFAKAGTKIKQT